MIVHAFRHAGRRLLARPAYSALSIGVLGLGLGAMLFMLGLVNGLILQPMPFPDRDRLLAIGTEQPGDIGIGRVRTSDYLLLQDALRSVDRFGVYAEATANISRDDDVPPRRYAGAMLSADAFELLGVTPMIGRGLAADDDRPGAPMTVLLSERVWREDFAADRGIVGRRLRVNSEAAEVIGVLPAGFAFPSRAEVWLPRRVQSGQEWAGHGIARLAPESSLQQARTELEVLAERLGDQLETHRENQSLRLKPLKRRFVTEMTQRVVLTMFAAGMLVMLLACANVASLQLAQSLTRRRELAVRSALGAARGRLLHELLAESLLLSLIASAIGLAIAHLGGNWLHAMFVANDAAPVYYVRFGVDLRMAGFGLLAAFSTTLLAGLLPALRASQPDLQATLRDGDKGSGGGFARVARGLVVAEVALTVVLLVGAGMFARALDGILDADIGSGADPRHVVTGRIGLAEQQYPTGMEQVRFFEQVVDRLRADPNVLSASAATALPGAMAGSTETVGALGEAEPATGWPTALAGSVDDHFAETYGLDLLAGRFFDPRDPADARSAVIDRRLAESLWPGREAVGQKLLYNPQRDELSEQLTVIGVVGTLQLEGANAAPRPTLLLSLRQYPARFATIAVRLRSDAESFAPQLAATVRAVDTETPVYALRSQQQAIEMGRIDAVVLTQVFSAVGLLALLLAAAGLYGVLAFAVEQRRREIGIRRAVGAGSTGIVYTVCRRLSLQVAAGLAIGVGIGIPWSALLENPALQTRGHDVTVFVTVLVLIVSVAALSTLAPLRRALRVDPIVVLRHE
jgi:putative ABC transport system permease protein